MGAVNIMSSVLDMMILRCLGDIQAKMSSRQLAVIVQKLKEI